MPDSGMVNLGHHHGHGAQPPFYSPPAPPPPSQYHHHHHPHHLHNNSFNQNDQMEGNSSYHLTYQNNNQEENNNPVGIMEESDSNGNGNGGNYPRNNGGNPNDPNNNQGMMIMLMEEDGHGGHGPPQHQNGGDMVVRDLFEEIRNGGGHWSQLLRQVVLTPPQENGQEGNGGNNDQENYPGGSGQGQGGSGGSGGNNAKEMDGGDEGGTSSQQQNGGDGGDSHVVPLQIVGGSENGQFVYVGITNPDINAWITVGYLQPGDILLEIQGQQVAGYTQADVISLLHHCLRGNSATLTVAPRGSLGPELRSYLNTRFQKGSVDHALQGVVRDNLYLRTVPVTTRTPRPGETNGVDYTFLSVEEFMQLEREGSLLESGVYAGNHYGTPKPWARLTRGVITSPTGGEHGGYDQNTQQQQELMEGTSGQAGGDRKGPMLPGMHPSSEGKRRRNRSNVEALGAGAGDEEPNLPPGMPSVPQGQGDSSGVELGPLPANWEMAYTDNGEVYFIDHNTGTSHWLDPRLSRVQKLSLEDCAEDELPFGWERIEDPHYGVYYIDHVNRRTQFENPVIQAKASQQGGGKGDGNGNGGNGTDDSEADSTSRFLSPEQQYNSQYAQPPPMQYPPNPPSQQFQKRPTSLAKPVPPIPNPKPQNPHRLSLAAKQQQQNSVDNGPLRVKPVSTFSNRFFTRDPTQLIGERITTTLVKSSRGLGFTIVGGDDDDGLDEFLQIKSVVAEGPAWIDGKLRTGDVLVKVNGTTVLGYTHQEMVSIFQSISPGEDVQLEVCRGYPLPFDPSDPNTEIVTTVAVAMPDGMEPKGKKVDWARSGSPDSCTHSAHSLPELGNNNSGEMGNGHGHGLQGNLRPASVDLLLDGGGKGNGGVRFPGGMFRDYSGNPGQESRNGGNAVLTVNIVKGVQGFGFTIADSVTGQKVKKVLDSGHCGELEEGDRLIALDGLDLRGLSHTQVVQILKDFPVGREASLTIQRSPPNSPYGNTGSSVDGQGQAANFFGNGGNRPLGISPRSKTPTAEMGRQRHRLPERSKTPQGFPGEGYSGGFPGAVNGELSDLSREWVEMSIELERRQEGFGFRIVGGTEEGSQVSVGHIVPGGAANLDGRLQSGDQLLAVDGISVVGASHRSVVQLMARSAGQGKVGLTVRRNVGSNAGVEGLGGSMVMTPVHSPGGGNGGGGSIAGNSVASGGSASPIHVTLRRQPSEGFGFVIISSASKAGATIGKIVGGSPADRCGELRVGDRILAVNNLDISQLHHTQVVQLIKESGFMLTLSVLPVGNGGNNGSVQMQQSSPMIGGGGMEGFGGGQEALGVGMEGLSLGMGKGGDEMDDGQVFGVQLARGNRGFGFSIRGGKEFQNMPLFVLRLAEDGPAAIDGRMLVGDQIVQINGINTGGMTHAEAIHLIKTGGASVHLLLRRGSVPFPFLSQVPGMAGGGFVGANGQEMEEQSLSNASNNNDQQQQFLNMSMNMNQNQQQQQHQNSYQFQYHHQNNAGF